MRYRLLLLIITSLCLEKSLAQVNHDLLRTPDTLSVVERLQISTNMVDWTLQFPNIGIEYDWGGVTWNRWAVGLKARGNWQTKHHFKPAQVWNLMETRAEVRHYWHTRLISKEFPKNTSKLKKLISCRRDSLIRRDSLGNPIGTIYSDYLKHPNTTYYRGFYLSYAKYSFLLSGNGRQGRAVNFGFLYGIVKPLYQFANGNTLDLDLGLSVGLTFTQYDEYRHNRESDCYERYSTGNRRLIPFPLPHELRVGLTYRFTNDIKHQLPQRYRWRFDVDEAYRNDFIAKVKRQQEINDSTQKARANIHTLQEYFDLIYNNNYSQILQQVQKEMADKPKEEKEGKKRKERRQK